MWNDYDTAEWLLCSANIDPELEQLIRRNLAHFAPDRLARCVAWLRDNQTEPRDPAKQSWARWRLHNYGF